MEENRTDGEFFTLANVLELQVKLETLPEFSTYLEDQNDFLKQKQKGQLTPRDVALIACIVRKNIRQSDGYSSMSAPVAFYKRSTLGKGREICKLQVVAATAILGAVGFLRQVGASDHSRNICSRYELLNVSYFAENGFPTLNSNHNLNLNKNT